MLIEADLLDAPVAGELRHRPGGALLLDAESGELKAVGPAVELCRRFPDEERMSPPAGGRLLAVPGLIDTHAHLPQLPAVARREESLLPWLERHIFPLERAFRGVASQGPFIEAFFDEVVRNGTTTIVLYSAIWEDSTELAFEVAEQKGIRAVIGKVMMDEGSYGEADPAQARALSVTECRRLIEKWHGAADGRLEFVVSPRFAVSCSMALMQDAAELAREHGTYIQTHLSESGLEIATVRERFPGMSYTEVYDRAGLLTERTLLGHCLHLAESEVALIAERGARVTHCPTSNLFLRSGLFPHGELHAAGIPISLGSDVAAGPELNMWQVMRGAVEMQIARALSRDERSGFGPAHAFHLATAGAAAALHKSARIGTLDEGREADVTVIDLNRVFPLNGTWTPADLTAEQILTACVYRAQPTATVAVFVRGRQVH